MTAQLEIATNTVTSGDEVMPTFLALSPGEEMSVIACPFENERDKQRAFDMAAMYFLIKDVSRYVFASEAWVISRDRDGPEETRAPSECEDRSEVISVTGVDRDEVLHVTAEITRDGDRATVGEPRWITSENGLPGGTLTRLLPPEGMRESMPQSALDALRARFEAMGMSV